MTDDDARVCKHVDLRNPASHVHMRSGRR
jgi:hypothetical protein